MMNYLIWIVIWIIEINIGLSFGLSRLTLDYHFLNYLTSKMFSFKRYSKILLDVALQNIDVKGL